jgi:hypothetical protein
VLVASQRGLAASGRGLVGCLAMSPRLGCFRGVVGACGG